jgi:phospholipase/lecithinase/hemolysin
LPIKLILFKTNLLIITLSLINIVSTQLIIGSHDLNIGLQELIDLGAVTVMVPGNLPIGCSAAYLTYYETADKEEYDPETGCLTWLNKFAEYHNEELQKELTRIQALYPHTTIIYADYYNAAMRFYRSPTKYGNYNTFLII